MKKCLFLLAIILDYQISMAQTNPPIITLGVSSHYSESVISCDINNDGHDDLIMGAPYSDIFNETTNEYIDKAGALVVYYGTDSIPDFDNPQIITLKSPGLDPSKLVTGYYFGIFIAKGDFNNDGLCDIVAKGRNTPKLLFKDGLRNFDSHVFWGSNSGLTTNNAQVINLEILDSELWNDPARRSYWPNRTGWGIQKFHSGNFNGDEYEDLLLTHPGQAMFTANGSKQSGAGAFYIVYGSNEGLDLNTVNKFDYENPGVRTLNPGPPRYQVLASEVSSGDFNGDGFDDVAVRASGRKQNRHGAYYKGGNVYVFYGSSQGITTEGASVYNQDTDGIAGKDEEGDWFGFRLISGDLNNDGYEELVISVPYEDFKTRPKGGSVQVLPGSINGVDPLSSYGIHMYKPGFNNPPQGSKYSHHLRYGYLTAVADINSDGENDLIVPNPWDAYEFRERMPGDSHSDWRHVWAGTLHILPSGKLDQAQWVNSELVGQEVKRSTNFSGHLFATGDFNKDGNLDFVTTGRFEKNDTDSYNIHSIYIIFGDGSIPDSDSGLDFIKIPINTDFYK